MFIKSAFFLNLLLTLVSARCQTQCIRKEIHDLSQKEWRAFSDAVLQLASPNLLTGKSRYDAYATMHQTYMVDAHGSAQFPAWHRQFISSFEKELQTINPSICLPHWNWSLESDALQNSIIWNYLGQPKGASQCKSTRTSSTAE